MHVRMLALVSFFTFWVSIAGGQQAAPPDVHNTEPISLSVVVTPGRKEAPVAGLPQSSFAILDNGAPQAITSFRTITGQAEPVKVLLVLDAVNVPYERVAYEREQVNRLLRANDGRLAQPTALAVFTDTGTQIQPGFSTDGNALSAQLDKQVIGLRTLRRSAGFYGAAERLDLSVRTLNDLVTRAGTQPGRKFIIWITPGWPLLSGPGIQLTAKQQQRIYNQVIGFSDALRRANTTLYTVDPLGAAADVGRTFYYQQFLRGLNRPSQAVPGDLGVQVLSEQSGGRFLTGSNDIKALLDECFLDATVQYEITYQPPPPETSPEYHKIEVRMTDPHLIARTRTGYYAHP